MNSKETPHLLINLLFLLFLHQISCSSPAFLLPKQALPTRSGYLPVNSTTGSAIFYTFYEAQTPTSPLSQTPLLIWLQGGPGCSSMIGNFLELGPWRVNFSHTQNVEHLGLEPNSGSWNRIFGLLFVDNPIGTGFSFAATEEEIPRDQFSVAEHLFIAISGFLESDPLFKTRPVYFTGESYAGKYVPAIGYYTLKKNLNLPESKRVNLQGVAIGNGLTDPETQITTHAVNAYFSGLINERQKSEIEKAQWEAVKLVRTGNWSEATNARNGVFNLLQNMTGLATLYDYTKRIPYQTSLVTTLLQIEEVKKALGAKESIVFDECSDVVGDALHEDVMKSVKYMVEFLVKNSKVLLYQGFFDLKDGFRRVNEELAGYVQKWGGLSHAVVLGAGHFVPTDQSLRSQAMIENWVIEKGVFGNDLEQPLSDNFTGSI
ncbi:hypothetical protein Patl1_15398 [Pistacia atlantica]|uniref:Uncharacterized protein n=1 Tax=Pistacia atlantica TaxID=434234 RepID=A0ACC1B6Y0_9ROSI|nr:hypothetical protein Patl1_15398 [Pistacia atlantica]